MSIISISRLRRNHALEHATMNILNKNGRRHSLIGYSDFRGFWLIGHVDTQDLQLAVDEALLRLGRGERSLAISPNCGTNLATSGILAGIAAWLGLAGSGNGFRRKLERLPIVIALVTLALIFAQPLGPFLQERVTTQAEPDTLRITEIRIYERNGIPVHLVLTKG